MFTKLLLIGAVGVGFALGAGFQQVRIESLKAANSKTLQQIAETNSTALIKLRDQAVAAREQHQQQLEEINETLDITRDQRDSYLKRLRITAANTTSANCSRPSSKGNSCEETLNLYTNLLERHTRELQEVGEYADELRVAGQLCEGQVDPSPVQHSN